MNSTAFCHDSARGADDSISGLVALLAAADTLSGVAPGNLPTRRIVFAAFQGEAYGAIGSRKFVADVELYFTRRISPRRRRRLGSASACRR